MSIVTNILNQFLKVKPIDDSGNPLMTDANPAAVKLTGSNVLDRVGELKFLDKVQIRSTSFASSDFIDLSEYKAVIFFVINTHDKDLNITLQTQFDPVDGPKTFREWNGNQFVDAGSFVIPSDPSGKPVLLNTISPFFDMPFKQIRFSANPQGQTPTSGSVSIIAWVVK